MDALLADNLPGSSDRGGDGGSIAPKVGDIWYRYDDRTYCGCSLDQYDGEHYYTTTQIEITRYKVLRVTPKGVQLVGGSFWSKRPRLVLFDSYKRFACATQAEALESYEKRKMRQAHIYQSRANKARECLLQAQRGRVKFVNNPEGIHID